MPAVVLPRADLPFPGSLPEFQRLFPDNTACAAYLEAIRWRDGFVCKWCGEASEPYRFANRPQVLRCRKCDTEFFYSIKKEGTSRIFQAQDRAIEDFTLKGKTAWRRC